MMPPSIRTSGRLSGFALLEILIALIVAAIALLGLGTLQLKALQSAYSSLEYTVATIHANNLVERVWGDLCNNQASAAVYTATLTSWRASLPAGTSGTVPTSFASSGTYTLNWSDSRLSDNNTLALQVTYPAICP